MNAYFFKLTREEKENILDKHKHVYDGFVTQYVKPNQQPLYVQDFANDKGGITVNNRGEVLKYKNVGINEDIMSGAELEPKQNIESRQKWEEDYSKGLDMIGDGPDDLENGTINNKKNKAFYKQKYRNSIEEMDDMIGDDSHLEGGTTDDTEVWKEPQFKDKDGMEIITIDISEEEEINSLQESVNKSLDMFRRFKNY